MDISQKKLAERTVFKSSLLIATLLLICALSTICSSFYYLKWYNDIREKQYVNSVLLEKKNILEQHFANIKENIDNIASAPEIKSGLEMLKSESQNISNNVNDLTTGNTQTNAILTPTHKKYNIWFKSFLNTKNYTDLLLLDKDGNIIYSATNKKDITIKTNNEINDLYNKIKEVKIVSDGQIILRKIGKKAEPSGYLVALINRKKIDDLLKVDDESIILSLSNKDINSSSTINAAYLEILGNPWSITAADPLPQFQFINLINPVWQKITYAGGFIILALSLIGILFENRFLLKFFKNISVVEKTESTRPTLITEKNSAINPRETFANNLLKEKFYDFKNKTEDVLKNFANNLESLYSEIEVLRQTTIDALKLKANNESQQLNIPENGNVLKNIIDLERLANLALDSENIIRKTIDETNNAGQSNNILISRTEHLENAMSIANDLTKQINLLALNTVVEVAKNKGQELDFSSLASEIRLIAFKTKRAVDELNLQMKHIHEASGSVNNTVHNIKLSVNKLKQQMSGIYSTIKLYQTDSEQNFKNVTPVENNLDIFNAADEITKYSNNALSSLNKISDQVSGLNKEIKTFFATAE